MAGYSGTPLVTKLGIKPGARLCWVSPPQDFDAQLGELPTGVTLHALRGKGPFDVIVVFAKSRAALASKLASYRRKMAQNGGLWIAWPKRSSKVQTDVTEAEVRAIALPTGLVDNKVCAIDDTWAALRLVIRVELRTAETGPRLRAPEPAKR